MRFLIVNDYGFRFGGSSSIALAQCRGLAALGHEVIFFCAMPAEHATDAVASIEGATHVECTGQWDLLSSPSKFSAMRQGIWNSLAARRLQKLLMASDATDTVVIINSFSKALSASVVGACRRAGAKTLLVAHDYFLWCPNGTWYDFKAAKRCSKKPMSAACIRSNCDRRSYLQKLWRVLRQCAYKFGGLPQRLDAVLFGSDFSMKLAAQQGSLLPQQKLVSLPCADFQTRIQPELNRDFVFLGRLDEDKGAKLFADAMAPYADRVIVIGDGELREYMADKLPSATFTGWLQADEIQQYLQRARAVIAPTLLPETFGLGVYEAASMGVPSVVPHGSAPAEFVERYGGGLRFDSGSVASLSEAIEQLIESDQVVATLSAEAYAGFHAEDRSEAAYAKKIEEIAYQVSNHIAIADV